MVGILKVALEVTEDMLPGKVRIRKRGDAVHSLSPTPDPNPNPNYGPAFSPASLALITNDPIELFTYASSAFLSYRNSIAIEIMLSTITTCCAPCSSGKTGTQLRGVLVPHRAILGVVN
jgi:hypothetical protein